MASLKKDMKVTWRTSRGINGSGVCIQDEQPDGTVLVAVDVPQGEPHPVIHCTATWLTIFQS